MSLERKDLRLKVDSEIHQGLQLLARVDGDQDLAEWAEAVLEREVRRRIREATLIATQAQRMGISGSERESRGTSGSDQE